MANQHGDFIWYELLTSDADAAAALLWRGDRLAGPASRRLRRAATGSSGSAARMWPAS